MCGTDKNSGLKTLVAVCLLVMATLTAYMLVLNNQFVIYDDPEYVTDNAAVLAGVTWKSISWAFTSSHSGNWHPLTWLSHMLDVTLYGLEPRGHHLTSLLFHTANTVLLFTLLRRLTGVYWSSMVVALLFALHPLHVESVAWVAERKDLLSAFFLFLTLYSYYRYSLQPRLLTYIATLLLGICGLMTKQMFVTLPLLLLLLDFWPLNRFGTSGSDRDSKRIRGLVVEKLPFFAMAAGAGLITYITHEQVGTVASITPPAILENAVRAVVNATVYIVKMFLPMNLAVFYPYKPEFPSPEIFVPSILFCLVMSAVAVYSRRRFPFVTVGWFWYLVTLLPVSGIIQIGNMSMADRYTYVPLIGPFVAVVWVGGEVANKIPRVKAGLILCTCFMLIILGMATFRQTRYWYNGITLFSHASIVIKDNWLAYDSLGAAYLMHEGTNRELNIVKSVRKPIPPSIRTAAGIGNELPLQSALNALREAVRVWPEYPSPHFNLGIAYIMLGNTEAAIAEYRILSNLNEPLARKLSENISAVMHGDGLRQPE